jgi:hypothetical protein
MPQNERGFVGSRVRCMGAYDKMKWVGNVYFTQSATDKLPMLDVG